MTFLSPHRSRPSRALRPGLASFMELFYSMAIVSVIASVVMVAINPAQQQQDGHDALMIAHAQGIQRALVQYFGDSGRVFPDQAKLTVTSPSQARQICNPADPDGYCINLNELADKGYVPRLTRYNAEPCPHWLGYTAYLDPAKGTEPIVTPVYLGNPPVPRTAVDPRCGTFAGGGSSSSAGSTGSVGSVGSTGSAASAASSNANTSAGSSNSGGAGSSNSGGAGSSSSAASVSSVASSHSSAPAINFACPSDALWAGADDPFYYTPTTPWTDLLAQYDAAAGTYTASPPPNIIKAFARFNADFYAGGTASFFTCLARGEMAVGGADTDDYFAALIHGSQLFFAGKNPAFDPDPARQSVVKRYDPASGFTNIGYFEDARSLLSYQGSLYVGSRQKVLRYNGFNWFQVGQTLPTPPSGVTTYLVGALAEYNNQLFAGAGDASKAGHITVGPFYPGANPGDIGGRVYRYDNGTWTNIALPLIAGDSIVDVNDLEVYNGLLYAGVTALVHTGGTWHAAGLVYAYDGANWTLMSDELGTDVHALTVYKDELYAGTQQDPGVPCQSGPSLPASSAASSSAASAGFQFNAIDPQAAAGPWWQHVLERVVPRAAACGPFDLNGMVWKYTGGKAWMMMGGFNNPVLALYSDSLTGRTISTSASSDASQSSGAASSAMNQSDLYIRDVQVTNITKTSAIISWATSTHGPPAADVSADSQVEYGPAAGPPYAQVLPRDPTPVIRHSMSLSGLTKNTVYHFRVNSRAPSYPQAFSQDLTFKTASDAAIEVWQGTTQVQPGSTVDYGTVQKGASVSKVFRIKNVGTDVLAVNSLISVPAGFTITVPLSATQIAPGGSATFTVQMDAATEGSPNGRVSIDHTDLTKNPFVFQVQGIVVAGFVPRIQVLQGATDMPMSGLFDYGTFSQGSSLSSRQRTFTVKNVGTAPLTVSAADFVGSSAFVLDLVPPFTLNPGQSMPFTITLGDASQGYFEGDLYITSNDAPRSPFVFTVVGRVVAASTSIPQIQVLDGTTDVPLGGTVDLGSGIVNSTLEKTLTIKNIGNAPLTLSTSINGSAGSPYYIARYYGTPVAPGASTTLRVGSQTDTVGSFSGWISFDNNDPVQHPYVVNLLAAVTNGAAPKIQVLDGTTPVSANATVNFGATTVGTPITKTFTVKNIGSTYLTLQSIGSVPAGFTLVQNLSSLSLAPNASATFVVRKDATTVETKSGPVTIGHNDTSQPQPFPFTVAGTVNAAAAPDIEVRYGTSVIPSGWASPQFGSSTQMFFTVKNIGTAPLTLAPIAFTDPTGFQVTLAYDKTTLQPGETTTFHLGMKSPLSPGDYASQVQLGNNVTGKNPFSFSVTGKITAPAVTDVRLLYGGVTLRNGGKYNLPTIYSDQDIANNATIANNGSTTVQILPTTNYSDIGVLPTGNITFDVWNTTNTQRTLNPAQVSQYSTYLNQAHTAKAGVYSVQLSFYYQVANASPTSFSATLSGTVLERPIPQIQVSVDNGGTPSILTNGGSYVDYGLTPQDTTVTKTYTVKNTGNGTLNLSSLTIPSGPGFSVAAPLSVSSLAPNATATFSIRFDALAEGQTTGRVEIQNNDPNSALFKFYPFGRVSAPKLQVLDGTVDVPPTTGQVDVGSTQVNTSVGRTITLKNVGTAPLIVNNIYLWYAQSTRFTLSTSATNPAEFPGATLAPNQTATFYVKFSPTYEGDDSVLVNVVSNDQSKNPFHFTVKGKGTPEPAPHITVFYDGSPAVYDFGSHIFGDALSKLLTVVNDGTAPLTVSSLSVPSGYAVTFTTPVTIQPGNSFSWWLTFLAIDPAQTWNGFVTINSNASNNPALGIPVTGRSYCGVTTNSGLAGAPSWDSQAINPLPSNSVMTINTGSQYVLRFTFKNTGTAPWSMGGARVVPASITGNVFPAGNWFLGGGGNPGSSPWADVTLPAFTTPGYYVLGGVVSQSNAGPGSFGQIAGACIKVP